MNHAGLQIVEERIKIHEKTREALVVDPNKDEGLSAVEKQAIREERKVEDAVLEELSELRRLMLRN